MLHTRITRTDVTTNRRIVAEEINDMRLSWIAHTGICVHYLTYAQTSCRQQLLNAIVLTCVKLSKDKLLHC